MEQFSLDKWLQDKSRKLVTRDGRPARIVCWDRNTKYWKIVGLVTSPDGSTENPFTCDVNGNESDGCLHDHRNDLFFADEEEELTNLQKTLEEDCDCYVNLYNDGKTREELREWIKGWCPRIIDLARKEIEKEITKEVEQKAINHTYAYQNGYENGKYDTLKDLPKFKKIPQGTSRKDLFDMMHKYIVLAFNDCVDYYYLDESDLRKLPKEE